MFEEILTNVNWIMVLSSAAAAFVLGGIWFSPKVFGGRWMEEVGLSEGAKPTKNAMFVQAASTFLFAWLISLVTLSVTILVTLAIAGFIKANGLYAHKRKYAIAVEILYVVAMAVVIVVVQLMF